MIYSISYVFGITGHRDIAPDSITFVEESLRKVFRKYRDVLQHTPIHLLTPLADGADRIAAKIALEYGIKLVVPLPFEKDEYENDFSDESKKEFRAYLEQAENVYFVGYAPENSDGQIHSREAQYEMMGHHIADYANTLIAIWDQIALDKRGGTSKIVEYKRNSYTKNLYNNLQGQYIVNIAVNRASGQYANDKHTLTYKSLGDEKFVQFADLKREVQEFDEINDVLNKNFDHVKNETDVMKAIKENNTLKILHEVSSAIANIYRDRYQASVIKVMFGSWIALLCMQLVLALKWKSFMMMYVAIVVGVYFYYRFVVAKKDMKEKFLSLRGISSGAIFQYYWDAAGIREYVSHYYLRYTPELSWIRLFISNAKYASQYLYQDKFNTNLESLPQDWIEKQIEYYSGAMDKRLISLKKAEQWSRIAYVFGGISTVLIGLFYFLNVFHSYFQLEVISIPTLNSVNTLFMLLSGVFIMTGAFLMEKYIAFKGYKDEIKNFKIMKKIYEIAQQKIAQAHSVEEKKQLYLELGKQAISENSDWVYLHNSKKLHSSDKNETNPGFWREIFSNFKI